MPEVRADLSLDASDATGVINQLAQDIDAALANATLNVDTAQASTDIEALGSQPIDIAVTADTAEASTDINALADAPPVDVPVAADTTEAQTEINSLDANPVDVPVTADTGAAQAEIDSLGADPIDIPVTVDTGDASQGIADLTDEIDSAGEAGSNAASGGLGQFDAAAAETGSSAGKGGLAIAGLTLGVGELVHIAVDATTAQQQFNQTFGDMAKAANKVDIPGIKGTYVDLADAIGVSAGEIQHSLVVAFQVATNVIGLAGPPAVDYAKRVTDIAVNLKAQGLATGSVDDITKRLSISLEGGSTKLAKMGVHLDESVVAQQLFTNQVNGTNDALGLTDPKAKLAFARVQVYTAEAGDGIQHNVTDKSKQSQTELDRLQVRFEHFLNTVAAPAAIGVLDAISNFADSDAFHTFTDIAGQVLSFINVVHILDSLKTELDLVVDAAQSAGDWFHRIADDVRDFGVEIGEHVAQGFRTARDAVTDFVSNVVSRIADMGSSVGDKAHDIANRIGDGFTNAKNVATNAVDAIRNKISDIASTGVTAVINVVQHGAEGVGSFISGIASAAYNAVIGVIQRGAEVAGSFISGVASTFYQAVIDVIQRGAEVAGSFISGVASTFYQAVIDVIQKGAEVAGNIISGIAHAAYDAVINVVQKGAEVAGNIISGIAHAAYDAVINVTVGGIDVARNAINGLRNQIDNLPHVGPIPVATGGPVGPGPTYLVGEEGPELVEFGGNAFVTPAAQTAAAIGGGGGGDSGMTTALLERIALAIEEGSGDILVHVGDQRQNQPTPMSNAFLRGRR